MTKKKGKRKEEKTVDTDVILNVLGNLYEVPDRGTTPSENRDFMLKMLILGGLTDRQARSILLYTEGMTVSDISMEISNSKYTQNTSSALSQAVGKILRAITIVEAIKYDKTFVARVFERGAAIGSIFKMPLKKSLGDN